LKDAEENKKNNAEWGGGAPKEKDWEVNNCSLLTAHCSFSVWLGGQHP
jgi:hypothetical protein